MKALELDATIRCTKQGVKCTCSGHNGCTKARKI